VEIFEDAGMSGKSLSGREGLHEAIDAIERGEAEALVVSKLDRLSRSLLDFAGLMERARKRGWSLVALDLGVDTSTPSGEMMASVLATFAQFERRLIGQRTKDALAVKRAQGVVLGRPREITPRPSTGSRVFAAPGNPSRRSRACSIVRASPRRAVAGGMAHGSGGSRHGRRDDERGRRRLLAREDRLRVRGRSQRPQWNDPRAAQAELQRAIDSYTRSSCVEPGEREILLRVARR
jgi:hypothetical protein